MAEDSDDIAAAQAGDADAFGRLVRRHQDGIAAQMRRFTRDPAALEELVQDVFVEAYLGLRGYRGVAPWLHWLRRIAVRIGYRFWTRRGATAARLTDEEWRKVRGEAALPGQAEEAADLAHRLLAMLPTEDRLVLTLLHLEGCTVAEAAERIGWSESNTKVRAFRARERLRHLVQGGGDGG